MINEYSKNFLKNYYIFIIILLALIIFFIICIVYRNDNCGEEDNYTNWLRNVEMKRNLKKKSKFADKYLAKKYVNDNHNYIKTSKLLHIVDNPKNIEFNKLPSKYYIKLNTFSGYNFMIDNKYNKKFNFIKHQCKVFLRNKNKIQCSDEEKHYKFIKPLVLFEEYVEHYNDIMFYTVYGNIMFIRYKKKINNKSKDVGYFDKEWNRIPDVIKVNYDKISNEKSEDSVKPKYFNLMLKFVKEFSDQQKFPFCRIDLFNSNNDEVYFNEFTFSPYAGRKELLNKNFNKYIYENFIYPYEKLYHQSISDK